MPAQVTRAESTKLKKEFGTEPEPIVEACLRQDGCPCSPDDKNCLLSEVCQPENAKLKARVKKHFADKKAWHNPSATLADNLTAFLKKVSTDFEKGKAYLKTHKKRIIFITLAVICFVGLCAIEPLERIELPPGIYIPIIDLISIVTLIISTIVTITLVIPIIIPIPGKEGKAFF